MPRKIKVHGSKTDQGKIKTAEEKSLEALNVLFQIQTESNKVN